MIVKLERGKLNYFRKKARNSSVEEYCFLLGKRISPNLIEVYDFFYPKFEIQNATTIVVDDDNYAFVEQCAKKDGNIVLGSLHSHLNYSPVMSKTDQTSHKDNNDKVSGIVSVVGRKTFFEFWELNSSLPVKVKFFK